jgi:hypothetical protein
VRSSGGSDICLASKPPPVRAILGGIEMIHVMHKGQAPPYNHQPSLAEQFELLAA